MIAFIDNYDSFTYNIVQYLSQLGQEVVVISNDDSRGLAAIESLAADYLVVGPGPCSPAEAGMSISALREFAGKLPILGVCLGQQSMAAAWGGRIVRAKTLMHGKVSPVHHDGKGVFKDIPNPVKCTRYHSLVAERETLPECFEISAWVDDGDIMAIRHKTLPMEGVQFHPEAFLTEYGHQMLDNFLRQHAAFVSA